MSQTKNYSLQSRKRSQKIMRTSLSLAVGLFLSSVAFAQSSEGSVYGQAKAGSTVTVTNIEGGASRSIKSDAAGNFSLAKLPPGRYKIEAGGVTREVAVSIGSGTQVTLEGAAVEQIEVTASRGRSGCTGGPEGAAASSASPDCGPASLRDAGSWILWRRRN